MHNCKWRVRACRPHRGAASAYAMGALLILMLTGAAMLQLGMQATRSATLVQQDHQARALAEAAVDTCRWMMEQSSAGVCNINQFLAASGQFGPTTPQVCSQGRFWFEAWKPYTTADGTVVSGATGIRAYGETPRGARECLHVVVSGGGNAGVFDYVLFSDSTLDFRNYCFVNGNRSFAGAMTSTPNNRVVSASANWIQDAFIGMTLRVMSGAATGRTYGISSNNPNQLSLGQGDPGADGARKGDQFWVVNEGKGIYSASTMTFQAACDVLGPITTAGSVVSRDKCSQVPAGAPLTEHAPRQLMPQIDVAGYRQAAQAAGTYRSANYSAQSMTFKGTKAQPEIVFVEGAVYLAGGTFAGYGVIVSPTSVSVQNSFTKSGGAAGLAILCTGPVYVQNQSTVNGLIYSHNATGAGSVYFQNTTTLTGAVVADAITFQNQLHIDYDPALRQIGGLPGAGQGPMRILSWEDA